MEIKKPQEGREVSAQSVTNSLHTLSLLSEILADSFSVEGSEECQCSDPIILAVGFGDVTMFDLIIGNGTDENVIRILQIIKKYDHRIK